MIARASRLFPGVLVTMLLAGPAFAGTAPDATDSTRTGIAPEHRQPAARPPAKAATKLAGRWAGHNRRIVAARASATGHSTAGQPSVGHSVAFVDDGFSYTESATGQAGWQQVGVASWYGGSRWQGHRTSSGAAYDENGLTAAHATLPLGSRIRVSLHNSVKSVVVTITDRPGTRARIIDLSRGAASALGMLSQGVAMVTLSPL